MLGVIVSNSNLSVFVGQTSFQGFWELDFCCRMVMCFSRFNVVFQLDENLAVFLIQFHLEATFRLCSADFCLAFSLSVEKNLQ